MGEEFEYTLFHVDEKNKKVRLANNAYVLLQEFNEQQESKGLTHEIDLHPEFGNWMVEAVPFRPYGAYEDLGNLLTCYDKITKR